MAKFKATKHKSSMDQAIGNLIIKALKSKIKQHADKKQALAKANVKKEPKPAKVSKVDTKSVSTPVPEPVVTQPVVVTQPEPVVAVKKPYVDIFSKGDVKRTKDFGEYIHPLYKFGRSFDHTAEPHIGPVKYVTTLSSDGDPLVQPINDRGETIGKSFQAKPYNLTEK
jgi:hypothetical protein